jgi:hypothetical protein
MQPTPIVALIYDFDKTLSPQDMQEYGFLPGWASTPRVWRIAAALPPEPDRRRCWPICT